MNDHQVSPAMTPRFLILWSRTGNPSKRDRGSSRPDSRSSPMQPPRRASG